MVYISHFINKRASLKVGFQLRCDYLLQGYAINEKRLAQKQQEVEHLKTGKRILNRAIEKQAAEEDRAINQRFQQISPN